MFGGDFEGFCNSVVLARVCSAGWTNLIPDILTLKEDENMKSKNIIRPLLVTLLMLLIPVFGNQFVDGWNWSLGDFIIMGALIFGTGLLVELAVRKIKKREHRYIAVFLIIFALVWLWVELAVGLFTNWGS